MLGSTLKIPNLKCSVKEVDLPENKWIQIPYSFA